MTSPIDINYLDNSIYRYTPDVDLVQEGLNVKIHSAEELTAAKSAESAPATPKVEEIDYLSTTYNSAGAAVNNITVPRLFYTQV